MALNPAFADASDMAKIGESMGCRTDLIGEVSLRMARHGSRTILHACRGATTIEYGVVAGGLAAAITGALAMLGGDIAAVFDTTDTVIAGPATSAGMSFGGPLRVIAHHTFADGREGWSGDAMVRTLDQIGTGLSLSGESRSGNAAETVSRAFTIPPGASRAEISFDMSFVDSWDNEQAKIYLNGTEIGAGVFSWRDDTLDLTVAPSTGITATVERTSSVQAGTWERSTRGTDHVYAVRIAVDDPGETLTLGFGTTLDQSQSDESLMIGNVALSVGP